EHGDGFFGFGAHVGKGAAGVDTHHRVWVGEGGGEGWGRGFADLTERVGDGLLRWDAASHTDHEFIDRRGQGGVVHGGLGVAAGEQEGGGGGERQQCFALWRPERVAHWLAPRCCGYRS